MAGPFSSETFQSAGAPPPDIFPAWAYRRANRLNGMRFIPKRLWAQILTYQWPACAGGEAIVEDLTEYLQAAIDAAASVPWEEAATSPQLLGRGRRPEAPTVAPPEGLFCTRGLNTRGVVRLEGACRRGTILLWIPPDGSQFRHYVPTTPGSSLIVVDEPNVSDFNALDDAQLFETLPLGGVRHLSLLGATGANRPDHLVRVTSARRGAFRIADCWLANAASHAVRLDGGCEAVALDAVECEGVGGFVVSTSPGTRPARVRFDSFSWRVNHTALSDLTSIDYGHLLHRIDPEEELSKQLAYDKKWNLPLFHGMGLVEFQNLGTASVFMRHAQLDVTTRLAGSGELIAQRHNFPLSVRLEGITGRVSRFDCVTWVGSEPEGTSRSTCVGFDLAVQNLPLLRRGALRRPVGAMGASGAATPLSDALPGPKTDPDVAAIIVPADGAGFIVCGPPNEWPWLLQGRIFQSADLAQMQTYMGGPADDAKGLRRVRHMDVLWNPWAWKKGPNNPVAWVIEDPKANGWEYPKPPEVLLSVDGQRNGNFSFPNLAGGSGPTISAVAGTNASLHVSETKSPEPAKALAVTLVRFGLPDTVTAMNVSGSDGGAPWPPAPGDLVTLGGMALLAASGKIEVCVVDVLTQPGQLSLTARPTERIHVTSDLVSPTKLMPSIAMNAPRVLRVLF